MSGKTGLRLAASAALALLGAAAAEAQQPPQAPNMSYFVTSNGIGKGADLGGLAGADRQCQTLAEGAGVPLAARESPSLLIATLFTVAHPGVASSTTHSRATTFPARR